MGKTSSTVKNRYNAKAYDRITIVVKKSATERLKEHAQNTSGSVSAYIKKLISNDMGGLDL